MTNEPDNLAPPALSGSALSGPAGWPPAARMAFYTPVVEQPTLADRKATFLLTMTGLVATTLIFFLEAIARIIGGPDHARASVLAGLVASLIALLLTAARSAYAGYVSPMPQQPALTFVRHVAARDLAAYVREVTAASADAAVDAVLHYNYSAATQAAAKYRNVNRALACMRWAIPLWMTVLLLVALWR